MDTTIVHEGIDFGEGPRWYEGALWFSDFYQHVVRRWQLDGEVTVEAAVPGQPSGLGWLPDGRLLVVSMTDRSVLRREADGTLVQHADLSSIATFHCNDMVVDADGRAYVGNFGYDMHGGGPMQGADLALVRPDGRIEVAATDLLFPNGSVITPDGSTLIVGETVGSQYSAWDIGPDGALSNRRVWAETPGRFPDGCTMDGDGGIWFADPGGNECVRVMEGGEVTDRIEASQTCYACTLGGDALDTLYVLTAPASGPDEVGGKGLGRLEAVRVGHTG
jgi:sugar lactone lactonase YvrE